MKKTFYYLSVIISFIVTFLTTWYFIHIHDTEDSNLLVSVVMIMILLLISFPFWHFIKTKLLNKK